MAGRLTIIVALWLLWFTLQQGFTAGHEQDRGYLSRPPVFINSEYNLPLAAMGATVPPPRKLVPAVDFVSLASSRQPLLAGTTQHGTTLFLDPSFRFIAFRNVAVGLGLRIPVIKPDDGMVPDTRLDVIFYPGM
jgi:hypothetical protein